MIVGCELYGDKIPPGTGSVPNGRAKFAVIWQQFAWKFVSMKIKKFVK